MVSFQQTIKRAIILHLLGGFVNIIWYNQNAAIQYMDILAVRLFSLDSVIGTYFMGA